MFPDIFLSQSVENQAIIIYLSLMIFCTSFGAMVLHSVKRYLGCIQTRKIIAAQRALALSLLGYACFVSYQFGQSDFFELIAIVGNVAFIACGFQVLAASITIHPSRNLLLIYKAQVPLLTTVFLLFCFCTFIYPVPYVRSSLTLALVASCYLCGALYRGYYWKDTNFGDKIVTLSFVYCIATSLLPLSDRPGSSPHSVNGAIVLSQLPTMLGWFSGTLVAMISMHLHRIEELADRDWLTGLITERRFYDRVPDLIQLVNREKNVCCLAEIEVDLPSSSARNQMRDFQHLTLKTLADVIKASIRQTDISARVNDNTIAIFMPFAELDQAHRLIDRVNKRISQTVLFNDNKPFTITVSTGIHQLDIDEEIDSAFHRTHQALVAAQTNGGNQISTADLAPAHAGLT